MRSTRWSSIGLVLAVLAAACGKDSSGPGGEENAAPTANFNSSCTDLACSFTDLSSDRDGQVTSFHWSFGDGGEAASPNPNHTYAGGGPFTVTLTVADNGGEEASMSKTVTVSPAQNGAPTANFTVKCSSLDCTFEDLSTDADGTVVAWAWDFGDTQTSALHDPPVHHYNVTALSSFTATLTVTDNLGLTSTKSVEFTVAPAATLQCESAPGTGQFATCDLEILADAVVTVTLQSRECTAHGNAFQITEPIAVTLFTDGCYSPAEGTPFTLNGGVAFVAGTRLKAQVISGSTEQEVAPALHVEGAYPTWTLKFDDGEDATPPEPDFNDLILTITAAPVP